MPPVEFLPEEPAGGAPAAGTAAGASSRVPRRILAIGATLALVVAAAVVVATNGSNPPGQPAAKPSTSASSSPSPSATPQSTLTLPESVVFGPEAVDVLAVGNRIFALTPTLIGVTDRDTGALTVRPTPVGLSNRVGTGRLVADTVNGIIWVVAVGGETIGAYDTQHLDTLADATAPYPINDVVAMDEQLYFTTSHGLYVAAAGPGAPKRIGPVISLGAVGADRDAHEVLAADRRSPNWLHVLTSYGGRQSASLQVAHADSIAVAGGNIWVSGHYGAQAMLFHLDPTTLEVGGVSALNPQLGRLAPIVGVYDNDLLVYSRSTGALYCVNAVNGAFKQKWTVSTGAVTLNERGLLVATRAGIVAQNARDCLAG